MNEIRKQNGDFYRAKTIFEIILSIKSLIRFEKNLNYEFLKDGQFLPVKNSLDRVMKQLQQIGLGYNPKKVDVMTRLMEEELWSGKFLGDSNPRVLLVTLVFSLGVNLGLRSGEHRQLRRDMFTVSQSQKKVFLSLITYHDFFNSYLMMILSLSLINGSAKVIKGEFNK